MIDKICLLNVFFENMHVLKGLKLPWWELFQGVV